MTADTPSEHRPRRLLVVLPLAIFVVLAGLFLMQLLSGRDTAEIPSALIGQPAPRTMLPALEGSGLPGLDSAAFKGKVTLVNVFASWCAPCRDEHPLLMELAKDGRFAISGLNYKDQPEFALKFLNELGNPYGAIGRDDAGRSSIDWGVYGVPETFLVGEDATILFKHVGPLSRESIGARLLPEIEKALAAR